MTCGVTPVTTCLEFEDVQNPSLCLAANPTGNGNGVSLINCQLQNGGAARAQWIPLGHHLRNFYAVAQVLSVNGPLFSGRYLYYVRQVAPGSNVWQQWSGM